MIETSIKKLRDPFILVENGVYEAYGTLDGGHGMIFTSLEGQKYLCIHSPNKPTPEREEVPILIPVREANGTIVCIFI